VLLVDLDGVGRDGGDGFSTCLNSEAGLGVARWQIMKKAHDAENLKRLMEWLSRGVSLENAWLPSDVANKTPPLRGGTFCIKYG